LSKEKRGHQGSCLKIGTGGFQFKAGGTKAAIRRGIKGLFFFKESDVGLGRPKSMIELEIGEHVMTTVGRDNKGRFSINVITPTWTKAGSGPRTQGEKNTSP